MLLRPAERAPAEGSRGISDVFTTEILRCAQNDLQLIALKTPYATIL